MRVSINHEEMNSLLSRRCKGSNGPENPIIQANQKAAADFSKRARRRQNTTTGDIEFWAAVEISDEELATISRERGRVKVARRDQTDKSTEGTE